LPSLSPYYFNRPNGGVLMLVNFSDEDAQNHSIQDADIGEGSSIWYIDIKEGSLKKCG
jgi:hypothetical protein